MKFSKIVCKVAPIFPSIIKLGFLWFAHWSNFYQWMERTFLKTVDIEDIDKWNNFDSPDESWRMFCTAKGLTHYGSDKWYMLFDGCSCPERFIYRRAGDCDDHSLLGFYYFGHNINFKGEPYIFQGLWAYVTPSFGHMVAVYENLNTNEFFVVSNGETFHAFNEIFFKDTKFIGKFKIINNKLKFSEMVIL